MEPQSIPLQSLQTQIKTFTHDYYLMQLPQKNQRITFQNKLPFYKDLLDFRGQKIQYAPIGRIYGTNQFGQKVCCHIHGYFPSFYIKLDEYTDFIKNDVGKIQFLHLVQGLFQEAYQIRKPIIFKGQVEQKLDFYGFHNRKQSFLKIYLYNPGDTLKMRELMGSGTICSKFFQCYEAHINYFMQMFTDLNILGIHEMNISGFTFRRNLPLMKLLSKFSPNLQGIMKHGWDVQQLYLTNPEHFNTLHKMSSCYIEIDFSFESIMNQFQEDNDYWSDCEDSFDSEDIADNKDMIQMNVKVTTALNEVWKDQMKRRQKFNIKEKPFSFIDYSNNIQSEIRKYKQQINNSIEQSNQQGQNIFKVNKQSLIAKDSKYKDALWISFLNKGTNLQDLKRMINSYKQKQFIPQKNQLTISQVTNYNQQLHRQKQQLISKVKSRWDYYETRKNNIINAIIKGERDQLPQWEDDLVERQDDYEDDVNEDQQNDDNDDAVSKSNMNVSNNTTKQKQMTLFGKQKSKPQQQLKSKNLNPFEIMMRKETNTVKYRNNFNSKDFKVKEEGIFAKCARCRNNYENCWCDYKQGQFMNVQFFNQKSDYERRIYKYDNNPPSFDDIKNQKIPVNYQRPYFSDFSDLLLQYNKTEYIADLKIAQNIDRHVVYSKDSDRRPITIKDDLKLPYFFLSFETPSKDLTVAKDYVFKYDEKPPTFEQVNQQVSVAKQNIQKGQSRLSLAKFEDTFVSDLILMKYELLVGVSNDSRYYGNPQTDNIKAIFFELSNYKNYYKTIKCILFIEGTFPLFQQDQLDKTYLNFDDFDQIFMVKSQLDLLSFIINLVIRVDVDLLISFDQQKRGIYYLLMRSIYYGIDLMDVLSRSCSLEDCLEFINFKEFIVLKQTYLKRYFLTYGQIQQQNDTNSYKKNSQATMAYINLIKEKTLSRKNRAPQLRKKYSFNIELKGRVNINLNRICEQELKLKSYTIQNVAKHMFRTQFCEFTDQYLNQLTNKNPQFVQSYFLDKLQLSHLIIHELNVIGGILQKSKIYGADFVSMMERGSQFKIEAVMCRVTKKRGYLTLSATRNQVANQSVLECRSLVIEPPKQFYQEPVLLFDFQSLYPSVMIAYNICYSTCIGSLKEIFKDGKLKKLGVSPRLSIDLEKIVELIDNNSTQDINRILSESIFVTPNKVAFVKKNIKQGLIPQILLQFLMTRIMIKKSTKFYKKQSIKHLLKQRQTALKLFMNVMYGYTGASFTGRMPCSQVADSVVEISKYCLKQSIDYLNNHKVYKGKVIYGDTDSIFFHLPRAKLLDCFEIGRTLAIQLTKLFPYPMEMKFEKVFESLVLVSKKRYYGKSFQTPQSKPKYEGKGLECVRRDGIEQTQNLMTKMINTLVDKKDLSQVKKLFIDEYFNVKKGITLENQLTLAKQVKFLKYSEKTMPAHGHAARRFDQIDPIMLPKYGERMKYVILEGYKTPLKERSIPVFQYLFRNKDKRTLDYEHYVNKLILPPLHRVFVSLISLEKFLYKNTFKNENLNLKKDSKEENELNEAKNRLFESKKLQSMMEKSENICLTCIGQEKEKIDTSKCIELNCRMIYMKKRVDQLVKHNQSNKRSQNFNKAGKRNLLTIGK